MRLELLAGLPGGTRRGQQPPPVGSSGPEHRDLRGVAADRRELGGQRARRVRDEDAAGVLRDRSGRQGVRLVAPPSRRHEPLPGAARHSPGDEHVVHMAADPRGAQEQPAPRLLKGLTHQLGDRVVQRGIGRRRVEQLPLLGADSSPVGPPAVDRVGQSAVPRVRTEPGQRGAVLCSATLHSVHPQTAACVVPFGDRRQRRAGVACEDGEHRDGATRRHERSERGTGGQYGVVEVGRYSQDRSPGSEQVRYHADAPRSPGTPGAA